MEAGLRVFPLALALTSTPETSFTHRPILQELLR